MKSIGVTLQRTYLTKTTNTNIVRHPAKFSNILVLSKEFLEIQGLDVRVFTLKATRR